MTVTETAPAADTAAADTAADTAAETAPAAAGTGGALVLGDDVEHQGDNAETEGDTFPRSVVDKLRRENADRRERMAAAEATADRYARALFTERVNALGLLADATDLPYDADALDNPDALRAAVETLLKAKPHLRTRRITARAGQGESPEGDTVSLSALLRQRA